MYIYILQYSSQLQVTKCGEFDLEILTYSKFLGRKQGWVRTDWTLRHQLLKILSPQYTCMWNCSIERQDDREYLCYQLHLMTQRHWGISLPLSLLVNGMLIIVDLSHTFDTFDDKVVLMNSWAEGHESNKWSYSWVTPFFFCREDLGVGAVCGGCSSAWWVHSCAPMWSIAEF